MFALSYLICVLIAALPLAMTVLQNRGNPPSVAFIHRIYRDLAYIAGRRRDHCDRDDLRDRIAEPLVR